MAGTYYQTDRLSSLIFVILITTFIFAVLRWDEKRHGLETPKQRREYYKKQRKER